MSYSTINEALYSLDKIERILVNMPYTLDREYQQSILDNEVKPENKISENNTNKHLKNGGT